MKTINKSALGLSLVISLLGLTIGIVAYRISPLFQHTVYYCQTLLSGELLQIPQEIQVAFIVLLSMFIFISLLKVCYMYSKTRVFTKTKTLKVSASLQKLLSKLNIADKVSVIRYKTPFAFCFGFITPHIYISNTLLEITNRQELEAVLRHEKYHLDHHDTLITSGLYLLRHFFFFFPILSDLDHSYRIEREVLADRAAIEQMGESSALISVLKKLLNQPAYSFPFVTAIADSETLEARIMALVHRRSSMHIFKWHHMLVSALFVGVLTAGYMLPVHAAEIETQTSNVTMVCFQEDPHDYPIINKSTGPYTPLHP